MPRKIIKCPICKNRMARVVYGLPTDETIERARNDEYLMLGGCCVDPCSPTYYCEHCELGYDDNVQPISPFGDAKDIWTKMYEAAKKEYHPEDASPFIQAHHVVAAVESDNTGKIYTGFCIEGASGVMNLCAERVAALNMYINEGHLVARRMIAFRDKAPTKNGGMPCGACREFFMQAAYENRNMEILTDFDTRKTVLLKDLIPNWWGEKRYEKNKD